MVLLAFQANMRPTTSQRLDLITVFEGVLGVNFDNMGIVFTFCDTMNMSAPTKDGCTKADAWLKHLIKTTNLENYEQVSQDKIPDHFLWSNEMKDNREFFKWL
jgi:hypothetical protein